MSNDKEYGADAKPRCADHKGTPTQPKGCRTCARIAVECRIVRKVVDDLLAKGYALATDQGDHRFYGECNPSRDRAVILHELMQVDEERLGVFDAKDATGVERVCQPNGWIYFVYGNDGYDVISDYTTDLDDVLKGFAGVVRRIRRRGVTMQHYSNPSRETEPHALPDVEVFHITRRDCDQFSDIADRFNNEPGWYYWYCFPGCLPDTDPVGPFASEDEAVAEMRKDADQ